MSVALLQLRATGAEPAIALAVLALSLLSIVLALAIAARLIRGYRRGSRHVELLALAVGLLLLTAVPELLRIGLPTLAAVETSRRVILTSGCQLLGLAAILWAIYGGIRR
ncbi:putative acyltransferase [Halarchaeum solikamskense]|uniref:hypothetical protein n=1 Tax=Halarchaeum nitratireducens TaxID=489913 RepID=UPI001B3AFCAB|nr:hypothetical protein [Halarchaeum solikamskense]MBP2250999.1 putative acyltransferase [Halarchaeum solikamskense]